MGYKIFDLTKQGVNLQLYNYIFETDKKLKEKI